MRIVLLVLALYSTWVHSESFGDQVVKCLAEKHADPDSIEFSTLSKECEKQVTDNVNSIRRHASDEETANKIAKQVMTEMEAKQEQYDRWEKVMSVTIQSYYCYSNFVENSVKKANYRHFKDCDAAKELMWEMAYKNCFIEFLNPVSQLYVKDYFHSEKESEAFFMGASWTSQALVKSEAYKACSLINN